MTHTTPTVHYGKMHKTEVISFYEMPEDQQEEHKDDYEGVEESSFVESPDHPGEYLDLSNFMRSTDKSSRFHGIYGTSYFSYYGIILSARGDAALVVSC